MTVSNISCIGNLFEKGFEEKLFWYIFSTSHTKIYSHFLLRRNILIRNFCLEKRVIRKKDGKYFISKKLESSVDNTGKLDAKNLKLSLKEYHEQLFNFSQRKLLYIHYNFSIKKNKLFYEDFIKPIVEFYFRQDKSYFLKNKTKVFLDEIIEKKLQNPPENEVIKNKQQLKFDEFSDEEVRYLVINDIFESLFLIDAKLVKQLKTTKNVVNYACKKVLGETFDEDKQVETLLKPRVSRINTDIDTSNTSIYGFYKSYVRDLDIIKEEIRINDFISLDSDNRKLYLNNLEIDDVYLEDYLSSIGIDEFSKPSKVIAYNILEYKYSELNRDDIRQRCSRAERNSVSVNPVLNKLEKLDLKLLEANVALYDDKVRLENTKNYLKKMFSA